MRRMRKFLRDESGAAELIEAAIIYPVVFLCLFLLIYMGIFILQTLTVGSYARKLALLASREIACPGYIDMCMYKDETGATVSAFSSAAVELAAGSGVYPSTSPSSVDARPYRYFTSNLLDSETNKKLEQVARKMLAKGSIIAGKGNATIEVDAKNYFFVQYVTVSVKQPLMDFPLLDAFNIKPTVQASATAAVNDTDEFVRNVDFVADALQVLAEKIGINVDAIKDKVDEAMTKLKLK